MLSGFWLGILLSIPISLGTGLLIRPIQLQIRRRSKASQAAQVKRQEEEYRQTVWYSLYPERLTHYLFLQLVKPINALEMIVVGTGFPILSAAIMIPRNGEHLGGWERALTICYSIGGGLMQMWGVYTIGKVINGIGNPQLRISDFDSYVKTVPDDVRNLELEEMARFYSKRSIPKESGE
jgi:hypothetical protein